MRTLLLILLLPFFAFPQDACAPFVTRLHNQMELRNYADAFATFTAAPADCAFSDRAYADAEQLLQIRLDNAMADEKQQNLDGLFAYYDKFDQINPANDKSHLVKKAMAYKRHLEDGQQKMYALLDRAYATDRAHFTSAEALYDYFRGYHAIYSSGKATAAQLISKHAEISAILSQNLKTATRKQPYRFAMRGIDALIDKEMTCEKLIPVYMAQFDSNSDDTAWLEASANALAKKNCQSDSLYVRIARQWHKVGKSAESALALAEAESRRGNLKHANELLEESASLESDPLKKAETHYKIAVRLATSDPAAANKNLTEALGANPKMGRAYLLRATLYANSGCGADDFERKAMNFLAAKTAMLAASVQPELQAAAQAESARYLKAAPTLAEVKASKKSGKTLKPDCWITEPIKIPSK